MKSPWASLGDRVKGPKSQHNGPISATNPPGAPWLIIVYDFEATFPGRSPLHRCTHAIHFCAFSLYSPLGWFGGVGG
jgi:hypothetical protein